MSKIVQFCPLCGSDRSKFFERRLFHDREVVNRICLNCGLVYQSPCMDEAEAATFYATEYRLLNEGSVTPTARNISVQRARAESMAVFVRPLIGQLACHLDIGCSMGILLKRFEDAYHCHSVGIEPGEAHRNQAIREGLAVYPSLEELEQNEHTRFDLVSLVHVLEHLPDPVRYLAHLRETLLDPEGWLLIEVPNLYAHDSFETAHLVAYSSHTLRQTLEKAGFEIIRLEQHGRPRSAWLPLYITLLARPRSDSQGQFRLRRETWVASKRRIGMLWRHFLERLFPQWVWDKS
ncbi:MAG: class I SAM-dependent methyltransferase [Anaerolineales bacterium]